MKNKSSLPSRGQGVRGATNLLWTGQEYHSIENCLINNTTTGIEITSTIVGYYNEKNYKVDTDEFNSDRSSKGCPDNVDVAAIWIC